MHPLQKSVSWVKHHRSLILVLVWIFGTITGISQLLVSETSTFVHNNQQYLNCGERWPPKSLAGQLYTVFIFVSTFALPMLVLCAVYSTMGFRLLKYKGPGQQQSVKSAKTNRAQNVSKQKRQLISNPLDDRMVNNEKTVNISSQNNTTGNIILSQSVQHYSTIHLSNCRKHITKSKPE